ncbi:MAG: hypothetical protein AB7O28_06865 [Vicinamibacterales bacterium]
MRVVRAVVGVVVLLARAIGYEWFTGLVETLRRWWARLKVRIANKRLPHPARNTGADCLTVDHPALRRPDPCIYSQAYLTQLGLPVTWDNPDIVLLRNGVVVPEHDLQPNTAYEIEATIWNNSFTAPVIGLGVTASFLTFGVATTSTPIGATTVDVGAKGAAGHPAKARLPWVTPATAGHFCLQIALTCADDVNPANNLGQNNVDVVPAQSPANFAFQLRNDRPTARRYSFTVDTYTPLDLPECGQEPRGELRSARIQRTVARHRAADFTVPADWTVAISPATPTLAGGDEVTIHVQVTPPAGFTGDKPFNVNAYAEGAFAGGVTLVARVA